MCASAYWLGAHTHRFTRLADHFKAYLTELTANVCTQHSVRVTVCPTRHHTMRGYEWKTTVNSVCESICICSLLTNKHRHTHNAQLMLKRKEKAVHLHTAVWLLMLVVLESLVPKLWFILIVSVCETCPVISTPSLFYPLLLDVIHAGSFRFFFIVCQNSHQLFIAASVATDDADEYAKVECRFFTTTIITSFEPQWRN